MKPLTRVSKLLLGCGFLLFLAVSAEGKTLLRMNHQFPANAVGSYLDQWFADQVFERTKGEVEIRIYWSNSLGEPQENLTLLKSQTIEMAAMSAGYFPNQLPLHAAPNSIPMGMDNICQASRIMKAFTTEIPAFKEEASNNGIRSLFFHLLNPYLLVTKTPVTRLSDLNGKKIRTWGDDMPKLVKAAGAIPVTLFLPDIYNALKHGVIDGCPFSTDLTVAYRIFEQAKHVTEVVLWEGPSWGIWISEKSWQELKPEYQQAMQTVAELTRKKEIEQTLKADSSSREYLKTQGVQFHPFPQTELQKWKEASPDFFKDLEDQMKQRGLGDAAKQMIQIWQRMLKEVQCP